MTYKVSNGTLNLCSLTIGVDVIVVNCYLMALKFSRKIFVKRFKMTTLDLINNAGDRPRPTRETGPEPIFYFL